MTAASSRARAAAEYDVIHFRATALIEALARGTATYWLRRAQDFDRARPRPGDYLPPGSTAADVAARDARHAEVAELCRHRAAIALVPDDEDFLDAYRALVMVGDLAGLGEAEDMVIERLAAGHQQTHDWLDRELLAINRRLISSLSALGPQGAVA